MISRRGAAFIAALFLCGNLTLPASALTYRQFSDVVPGVWYTTAVESINAAGLVPPSYGASFSPAKTVSAAEFSYALLLSQGKGWAPSKSGESWATACLREMSHITGEELEDGPITRLQAAKMIVALKQIPLQTTGQTDPFSDTHDAVAEAVHREGIITGMKKDGQLVFAGEENLSRAQMAVIINRLHTESETTPQNQLYAGIGTAGFLIDPNIALPQEPKTPEDFRRVMEYMAANDLTTVTLEYLGNRPEGFMAETKEALSDALHALRYERSEYFSYLPKTKIKTTTNRVGGYALTIELAAVDENTNEMLSLRREAFSMAQAKLEELYKAGTLTPDMSDTDRARAITRWVATNTKYVDGNAQTDHTAWSVFANGTGVCDGFSSALQLLLSMDNIQCWGQFGHVKQGGAPHQWTLALLDGEVVGIDAVLYAGSPAAFGMSKSEMDRLYTFD